MDLLTKKRTSAEDAGALIAVLVGVGDGIGTRTSVTRAAAAATGRVEESATGTGVIWIQCEFHPWQKKANSAPTATAVAAAVLIISPHPTSRYPC